MIYEGGSRGEAAKTGTVGRQIIRDWVLAFNAEGPVGLLTGKAPGQTPLLSDEHRRALAPTHHPSRYQRNPENSASHPGGVVPRQIKKPNLSLRSISSKIVVLYAYGKGRLPQAFGRAVDLPCCKQCRLQRYKGRCYGAGRGYFGR